MVKTFLIVTNMVKDPGLNLTEEIDNYIVSKGGKVLRAVRNGDGEDDHLEGCKDADCVIVIGGDGSILQAAREIAGSGKPILGVNAGTLGFLAETDPKDVRTAIDRVMSGDYEIRNRMMLNASINSNGGVVQMSPALNDIVISRYGTIQIINLSVYVNGEFLFTYSGDGIIIATPTGSTGYNLSAGGPIVQPEANLILLTPICAHTLNTRSIVLSDSDKIEVEIGMGRNGGSVTLEASADGSETCVMHSGDRITITRSQNTSAIIKLSNASFLQTLNKKLK